MQEARKDGAWVGEKEDKRSKRWYSNGLCWPQPQDGDGVDAQLAYDQGCSQPAQQPMEPFQEINCDPDFIAAKKRTHREVVEDGVVNYFPKADDANDEDNPDPEKIRGVFDELRIL